MWARGKRAMAALALGGGLAVGWASVMRAEEQPRVTGAGARYESHAGTALITRVEKTAESAAQAATQGGPGYAGYEVWFVFTPEPELADARLKESVARERQFRLVNSWYPGARYLAKYGIEAGKRLACVLKVAVAGTASPLVFEFEKLDARDYFETRK
jgi:hypothetical protein